MSSVLNEVIAIRSLLNNPLPQSPSFESILEGIEAEYTLATQQTNNKGNAWQKAEVSFTTSAGVREYQILTDDNDFDKPLVVTTVPANNSAYPEYVLEFTEVENISKEWGWTGTNKGQFTMSSHDSQLIAFFHKLTDEGDEVWCELRPTPSKAQVYKVMYQVGDWWARVFATQDLGYNLPYSMHKHYLRALVAQNLLYKCRWSFDAVADAMTKKEIGETLANQISRHKPVYDEWIGSLVVPDVIEASAWANGWDFYA